MKRFGMSILCLAVVAFSGAIADEKKEATKEAKFDAAALVGKWKIAEGAKYGEKIDKKTLEGSIVIKKDVIQILEGDEVKHEMSYTVNVKGSPVGIDMKGTVGPAKDLAAEGIIELKGDELKLCYSFPGEKRPAEFKSEKDSKILLFVLKKTK